MTQDQARAVEAWANNRNPGMSNADVARAVLALLTALDQAAEAAAARAEGR